MVKYAYCQRDIQSPKKITPCLVKILHRNTSCSEASLQRDIYTNKELSQTSINRFWTPTAVIYQQWTIWSWEQFSIYSIRWGTFLSFKEANIKPIHFRSSLLLSDGKFTRNPFETGGRQIRDRSICIAISVRHTTWQSSYHLRTNIIPSV